jgi:hypothetical protein
MIILGETILASGETPVRLAVNYISQRKVNTIEIKTSMKLKAKE